MSFLLRDQATFARDNPEELEFPPGIGLRAKRADERIEQAHVRHAAFGDPHGRAGDRHAVRVEHAPCDACRLAQAGSRRAR
jgi:hypothetical protein